MTAYKTILVHAGVDAGAAARARVAAGLAERFDGSVMGAGALAWDPYIDPSLGYVDGGTVQALRDQVDEDLRTAEATFRTACAAQAQRTLWASVTDYPDRVLTALARGADLIVASAAQPGDDPRRTARPEPLIMESGLPVLVLGPGVEQVEGRHVLIGWKDTRETRRAVADALPFLKQARTVAVVAVAENEAAPPSEAALSQVADRLARHGIAAQHQIVRQTGGSVSAELAAAAQARGADLLLLGAYGHSRLREWAFGGVTRELLAAPGRAVLFSR